MNKPIIVSYYTANYTKERDIFVKSIRENAPDFEFQIDKMRSRGRWIDNVYHRPIFILEMINKYKRDVIWVDIDAEFIKSPELFIDFKYDFGAYFHFWPERRPEVPGGFKEVMGGTLYFKNSPESKKLLNMWINLNEVLPKQPRSQLVLQRALTKALLTGGLGISLCHLPPEYTYIPGLMPHVTDPVIKHDNASVRYRNLPQEGFDKFNGENKQ